MRVGVDGTCWANGRGYGRFTRELCGAMVALAPRDEFVFFVDERAERAFELRAPNVRTAVVDQRQSPTEAASADGSRSPLDMLRLTRAVRRAGLDVFFSPSVYTYFPLPPRLPAVVTLHDAIAERFPELTLPSRRARLFWKLKVGLALRQARRVLTVSEFSRRELHEVLGVPLERIHVAVEAPAAAYAPSSERADVDAAVRAVGLPSGVRYLTYVGGFNPHKNVDVLVRAHGALVRELGEPLHLVLVGTLSEDVFHGDRGGIQRAVQEAGASELVHWPGFVADEDLRHLHSGALALVLPSQCEGFGLPAVEAAACGTPVVATTQSPLPELLEGGGRFVPPRDVDALQAALRELATDEDERLRCGQRALAGARALGWERGARAALESLHAALGGGA